MSCGYIGGDNSNRTTEDSVAAADADTIANPPSVVKGDIPSLAMADKLLKKNADVETITVKGVTFKMVRVDGGSFTMGATSEQVDDAADDEKPAHKVTLSTYYIGQTEVTQALWKAVMEKSVTQNANENGWGTYGVGSNYPMYGVSWVECQEFIRKLNQLTGKRFALPTEAQWEFAARGGNKSKGFKYAGSDDLREVAWYGQLNGNTYDNGNSGNTTHPVKTKAPNELGLYDMSGNVWEWCQDWYDYDYYSESPASNPKGSSSGSCRVFRGGSWHDFAQICRSSIRNNNDPDRRNYRLGLRLVLFP